MQTGIIAPFPVQLAGPRVRIHSAPASRHCEPPIRPEPVAVLDHPSGLFAQDCGWAGPPFRWEEDRRFLLRCELDSACFHLYLPAEKSGDWHLAEGGTAEDSARLKASFQTPRDAVEYIMDTFPIVKRKDEGKFKGDYRTKRVILEIYDALAESLRTGKPCQTRLVPPPADPRCCHPPRAQI